MHYDTETGAIQPLSTSYSYYITEEINEDSDNILCLIRALKNCGPTDTVNIYLNTNGGCLDTTAQIINSMRACEGQVVTHADGLVASAGSLIFFSGEIMTVAELSKVLIHNGDLSIAGKFNEVHVQSDFWKNYVYTMFHSVYEPYLSAEEVDNILKGQDIYLTSEQVIERLARAEQEYEDNNNENNDE